MSLIFIFCTVFVKLAFVECAEYSVSLAERLWYFTQASYCLVVDDSFPNHFDCDACQLISATSTITKKYGIESDLDTEVLITYDSLNNAITAAFAGTASTQVLDIITDLSIIEVDYPACASTDILADDCKIHSGFYNAYNSVADDVYDIILSLLSNHSNAAVELTGHSLGGALAAIGALDLVLNHDTSVMPSYVYTYGAPRFGDDLLAQFYQETVVNRTFRVTHGADPVPLVPPESLDFEHVPLEIYYPISGVNEDGNFNYTVCDGTGEDHDCINNITLDLLDLSNIRVRDHLDYMGMNASLFECVNKSSVAQITSTQVEQKTTVTQGTQATQSTQSTQPTQVTDVNSNINVSTTTITTTDGDLGGTDVIPTEDSTSSNAVSWLKKHNQLMIALLNLLHWYLAFFFVLTD